MKEFIDYLERKIKGCDSLGGMEREKAIYQSVLKDYRKQFAISDVVWRIEQLPNMTLEQAIEKAKPNLDKITDVDKHLDNIR